MFDIIYQTFILDLEMNKNCWEFKKCGRGPGGYKVKEFGLCPVCQASDNNQINNGKNAGRSCWLA